MNIQASVSERLSDEHTGFIHVDKDNTVRSKYHQSAQLSTSVASSSCTYIVSITYLRRDQPVNADNMDEELEERIDLLEQKLDEKITRRMNLLVRNYVPSISKEWNKTT